MDAVVPVGDRRFAINRGGTGRRTAIVVGELRDDADGLGLARTATIACDDRLVGSAVSDDQYALAGESGVALADLTIAHPLNLLVAVPGYRPLSSSLTVAALAPRPVRHDLALRRLPVSLRGRVSGRTAGPNPVYQPVSAASVAIIGPAGPGGELPLLLAQALPEDPVAGATLRNRALTALGPAQVTVLEAARQDDPFVSLADPGAIAAGSVLRFGTPHSGFWGEVSELIAHPDRPAPAVLAWLTAPLAGSVRAGDLADAFAKGAYSGPTTTPVGAAWGGEAVVWVDALPANGAVLVLRQPGRPDRYFDRNVLTGSDGDYAILGLARMATLELQVSAPGFVSQTRSFPVARIGSGPLDWLLAP